MYEGVPVDMQMERVILEEGSLDRTVYPCEILTYNQEEERIYLLSKKEELAVFSLDGIYRCTMSDGGRLLECEGCILERYWNKCGRIVVFRIKKGFYKKVLN